MNKEKPKQTNFRFYKRDRIMVRKIARKEHVSQSEAVRRAVVFLHNFHYPQHAVFPESLDVHT